MTTIFISYRRDDEPAAAGRLYDALVAALGPRSVFIDVDGIKPGVDFVDVLEEVLSRCDVLVAVVGRRWLEARDAEGRPRLADADDFVRLELIRALERSKEGDIRLLPLCVEGASMPRPDELPPELASFARLQAFSLRHVTWRSDVDHLLQWLQAQAPDETWATRATRRLGLSRLSRAAVRLMAALVALTVVVVVAVALALSGGGEEPQSIGTIRGAPTPLQSKPTAIAAGAGAIWVAEINGVVDELDPQTGHVRGNPIRVPGAPLGLAVGEGAVWVAYRRLESDGSVSGRVIDIDPTTRKPMGRPIEVGAEPRDVAIGAGRVWTANFGDGSVSRIDPGSRRAVTDYLKNADEGGKPADVAFGEGAVWVVLSGHQTLIRINPATGKVLAHISVSAAPESVVVGAGAVWVASLSKDTVTKIDAKANMTVGQPVVVGSHPDDLAIWRGALYVAAKDEGVVQRIDPASLALSHDSLRVGNGPDALAVYGDSLWVSNVDDSSAVRIAK